VKSASLVVIGDEILTGKVKDENSFVFAKTMYDRGVHVECIEVIRDSIETIAAIVATHAKKFDYVCTSGGVGPTHDDKTFDGIAKAFSLPIKDHNEAARYFLAAQKQAFRGDQISSVQMKMLRFPSPCHVHFIEPLWLPLVIVKNVYIFPGVPSLFEKMITGFRELFLGEKFYRKTLFTDQSETAIALDLKTVQDQNPQVAIGSYPQMPGCPYNVMVTIEGLDKERVNRVAHALTPMINGRTTESANRISIKKTSEI
jgi:molybdenum cofactor synthesis domain-containing protein